MTEETTITEDDRTRSRAAGEKAKAIWLQAVVPILTFQMEGMDGIEAAGFTGALCGSFFRTLAETFGKEFAEQAFRTAADNSAAAAPAASEVH